MGTEAVFSIFIKVVGSGAPQKAVVAALSRAAFVLGSHEEEGEFTELPISVSKLGLDHLKRES